MPTTTPQLYTAAQIAKALGVTPRAVRLRLGRVPADGTLVCGGNAAAAWRLASLPLAIQVQLEAVRKAGGFRDTGAMCAAAAPVALPPIAGCHPDDVQEAVKLRAALERVLANRNSAFIGGGDLVAMGLGDYRNAFGHAVTERHWRRMFQRTLERAGSSADFTRLELYLPDHPRPKPEPATMEATVEEDAGLAAIRERVQSFADPLQPSAPERELVWSLAVEWFCERTAAGDSARAVKEQLFDFLAAAMPALARSRDSLRKSFDRRLADPSALRDRRAVANAKRAKVLNTDELERIVYTAIRKYRNRVAPAAREVLGGVLGSRKSYVPESLRRAASPIIAALSPHQQGPRAAEKASPAMDLSYEGIRPMDCLVIDDATWNVYLKWPLPEGGWKLTRGQIILIIDFRTLRVLRFGIIPEEQPNSLLAFTVTTRAIAEFGIPKVIYLERGKVFAESKLMTGGKRTIQAMRSPGWDDIPVSERELGLQRLGIKIITARRARSKAVELVIGLLQNLTDGEVGYCGRNERFDRPEALTRLLKDAASSDPERSAKALAQFYTVDEWADRFQAHCDTYNTTEQEGKHLKGLSPDAALQAWWPCDDPPTKLDAACRHWLAHHRRPVDVRGGAVSFVLRGEKFTYRHEDLSPLEGSKVLAWIDPEIPEILTITNMKHEHPLTIERCQQPNALAVLRDETDPVLAGETAKVQRHQRYWAGVHRTLKAKFEPTFRQNLVSRKVVALGAEMTRQREETIQRREDTEKREQRGRSRLNKLGLSVATVSTAVDMDSASRKLAEAMAQLRAEEERESQL